MRKTGLEFAPGTTEECQRLVTRLFPPAELLSAYRTARGTFKTGDIVLVVSEQDASEFEAMPRIEWAKKYRRALGANVPRGTLTPTIVEKTAHSIMKLPFEAEAIWLVVTRRQQMPLMVVLYSAPYEMASGGN